MPVQTFFSVIGIAETNIDQCDKDLFRLNDYTAEYSLNLIDWCHVSPSVAGGAIRMRHQNYEFKVFGCKNLP